MINKKYRSTIAIIGLLATLSGGMFCYQNIYMPKHIESQTGTIYVAKEDIKAYTELKSDMFIPEKINESSILSGYITDISNIDGFKLKGNLLKGEAINEVRLTKDDLSEQGGLETVIQPDNQIEVSTGDYLNIYVLLTDKITKESSVKLLFTNKKVISDDSGIKNNISNATNIESSKAVSVNFTEEQLKDYYLAKEKGKILIAKVGDLDEKASSNDIELSNTDENTKIDKFDSQSMETSNAKRVIAKDGKSISVMYYEVQDGETLDTLSIKFKTTTDNLIELNNGKNEFSTGDKITVPAV